MLQGYATHNCTEPTVVTGGRIQEVRLYERTAWGLRYKTKTSITLGAIVSPKSPQGPGK